jgi:endogenous inhibitor of DNA gyrase (YacG/DUF329 family)
VDLGAWASEGYRVDAASQGDDSGDRDVDELRH